MDLELRYIYNFKSCTLCYNYATYKVAKIALLFKVCYGSFVIKDNRLLSICKTSAPWYVWPVIIASQCLDFEVCHKRCQGLMTIDSYH